MRACIQLWFNLMSIIEHGYKCRFTFFLRFYDVMFEGESSNTAKKMGGNLSICLSNTRHNFRCRSPCLGRSGWTLTASSFRLQSRQLENGSSFLTYATAATLAATAVPKTYLFLHPGAHCFCAAGDDSSK